ncbi:protein tyrosine phosphatase [Thecamonas trahens ATCC 50062]|uniref:Protein tyrosine phosphatase n=1 Tax=Thecamonas trahens ATCC 50062 TaxID=461836 RepID=A0A0L0DQT1_THETB|nr:protein tyrosine phosphatase [Thecamonas trahens ATCC 50062]KNC54381.1 protein tyrosine phosphatase [Thecamonas trahens ATCC 50062]|eukprot:XP_013753681.1 protein tyrosine phosphatase [Thecamonas trahens ATCC 50062]
MAGQTLELGKNGALVAAAGPPPAAVPWTSVSTSLGSRLRLRTSQFVHASHVRLGACKRHYIVAQGPTEAGVFAFWRMVWAEHTSVVVALTRLRGPAPGALTPESLEEAAGSSELCFPYWPMDVGQVLVVGHFEVEAKSIEALGSYGIRTELRVRHMLEAQKRRVVHLQYAAWPHHAAPLPLRSLIEFTHDVHVAYKRRYRPLLIHDSCGTGAAGVFAVAHAVLSDALEELAVPETGPLLGLPILAHEAATQRPGLFARRRDYWALYELCTALVMSVTQDASAPPSAAAMAASAMEAAMHETLNSPGDRGSGDLTLASMDLALPDADLDSEFVVPMDQSPTSSPRLCHRDAHYDRARRSVTPLP